MPEGCGPTPGFLLPQYGRVPSAPFPPQSYPKQGYASQGVPGAWQAAPLAKPAPHMPVNAALATASPSAAPRPTIRLQAPDTLLKPVPTPLLLPSPESLGVPPLSGAGAVPQ